MENDRLISKTIRKTDYEEYLDVACIGFPDYKCEDCDTVYRKMQPHTTRHCPCGGDLVRVEK